MAKQFLTLISSSDHAVMLAVGLIIIKHNCNLAEFVDSSTAYATNYILNFVHSYLPFIMAGGSTTAMAVADFY